LELRGPAARAQTWQTAMALPTVAGSESVVTCAALDASGNVYLVGQFKGTVAFGTTSLTSAGGYDVFVAKWNPASARFAWAQRAGGTAHDYPTAMAVNGTAVYVTGGILGPATFGGTALPGNGGAGSLSFLTKVNDAGATATFAWAQQFNGFTGLIRSLAISGPNLYVSGYFEGAASFGATAFQAAGGSDVFVAKLSDVGSGATFSWAQRAGGPDDDGAYELALRGTNVYVTGTFGLTAAFGSSQIISAGSSDVFVAKLTDAGATAAFTWSQRAGGAGYEWPSAMAVSNTGIYLTGEFGSAAASFGSTTLTNAGPGSSDVFVAKLTDAGASSAFAWAQQVNGPDYAGGNAIAVSGNSVYVAGEFLGATAVFGSTTLTNANRTTADVFLAKLTDAGTSARYAWVQQAGGMGDEGAGALLLNGANVYVAGYFGSPANFGSLPPLTSATANIAGYLATLTDPALTATMASRGSLSFSLAPNPARATATVRLPAVPGAAAATLTLTDALGRTLRTATVGLPTAGRQHELDLTGLAPGLYAVQVRAGSTSGTQRLVIE
jgi:hypothetical protein